MSWRESRLVLQMAIDIIQANVLEWLDSYDGPRFHGVLSDPPYALISIAKRFGPGQAPAQEGSDGRYSRLSAGFMGQEWDSFADYGHYREWVAEWAGLLIERALYPGAVCMFFGGTRTFHHLGLGLEMGGFEIVDALMWMHGQGFPKSHDISKFLDKVAGEERDRIEGPKSGGWASGFYRKNMDSGYRPHQYYEEGNRLISPEPITDEAENWDGYGTALKPSWEPIFLCRAPRNGMTFADLATEYGTGALWIDGGRIGAVKGDIKSVSAEGGFGHGKAKTYGEGRGIEYKAPDDGRWPANLLLSHHEDCVRVGEVEVEGRTINRFLDGMKPFGEGDGEPYESEQMPPETLERWACVSDCPVRMLDKSAARSSMGGGVHRSDSEGNRLLFFDKEIGQQSQQYFDSGGPSRFFYAAKASSSEKDKGLEDFYWKRTDEGWERVSRAEWKKLPKRQRAHGCIHLTVKPLELLRYLAKLFKPPDSVKPRLLVPFSGSGSEVIAARQAGWAEVVGVEMDGNYCEIAEARVRGNLGMFA